MTDVFFKGFGSWYAWGKERAHVIVPSYGANGVFSLNVSDAITFSHTGNLPLGVTTLYPASHPDSEFSRLENLGKTSKMLWLGDIGKYTADDCFFVIDEEQPKDKILVIASPYQVIPELKTVRNDGAGSQEVTESASLKHGAVKKRTRKTNLSRALDSAISTFSTKPSLDELWQFFQDDKDETGFIEDYTDAHLTWRDVKGKFHDTKKETIANYLSRIKS